MESKKRHRRTKEELLRDPEYCRKHGIKPQKAATAEQSKREKAATPEQKRRHRRTKEELLRDPEYCRKHNIPLKTDSIANDSPDNAPKAGVRRKKKVNESVKSVELRYLPKLYSAWEKVQGLMNELDRELDLRVQPKELMHFDFACSAMEQAFERLEREIGERT